MMFLKIVLAVVVVILAVIICAAFQPSDYVISRTILIQAPAEKIYPYLNNQKLAEKWGPWGEVDPEAKMTYSGPDEGPGAKASWDTKGRLGTGSATIVETVPNKLVRINLDYTKPMEMHQISDYIIETRGLSTEVTWRVQGKNTLPGRVACIFVNMDKMVGKMFEKGLSNLKVLVEKPSSS